MVSDRESTDKGPSMRGDKKWHCFELNAIYNPTMVVPGSNQAVHTMPLSIRLKYVRNLQAPIRPETSRINRSIAANIARPIYCRKREKVKASQHTKPAFKLASCRRMKKKKNKNPRQKHGYLFGLGPSQRCQA